MAVNSHTRRCEGNHLRTSQPIEDHLYKLSHPMLRTGGRLWHAAPHPPAEGARTDRRPLLAPNRRLSGLRRRRDAADAPMCRPSSSLTSNLDPTFATVFVSLHSPTHRSLPTLVTDRTRHRTEQSRRPTLPMDLGQLDTAGAGSTRPRSTGPPTYGWDLGRVKTAGLETDRGQHPIDQHCRTRGTPVIAAWGVWPTGVGTTRRLRDDRRRNCPGLAACGGPEPNHFQNSPGG
jgi:hypothetical protein